MKISNLIFGAVVFADDTFAGKRALDRGARPDMTAVDGVKCPRGGRPPMGGMCIPNDTIETPVVTENIDIDGITTIDTTVDPLNGQGTTSRPQNGLPESTDSLTTTSRPAPPSTTSPESTTSDKKTTTSRPVPPPPSTTPAAESTTEKKTTTSRSAPPPPSMTPSAAITPIDNGNIVNTDEPSYSGVSSDEHPFWWILPLTCVGTGTVLLGLSIYACHKKASPPGPQYLPGQIIGQESTLTKCPPAENSFPNGTSLVPTIQQQQTFQQVSMTQQSA
ncbi:Oidioi.mRNA.OKI2018_I69.chr2.g7888.t1.cds [Oikopleura dioica]|uniref:Oidioi.mRNA.OKI2018_I69.chr2.g7888.t1.cds n=1 Tax=Oikopleura dioica TaxID=34765 RepID=A0ABN7T7L1_OIKDI|nr:Oidioi.mRNA.OKI2018_I69.chr2.g7888.t1.cds [Oikopleura dioica]